MGGFSKVRWEHRIHPLQECAYIKTMTYIKWEMAHLIYAPQVLKFYVEETGSLQMRWKADRTEIFEAVPVKRAVAAQIIPSIVSQMILLLSNLADTYFAGMLNDPNQTAALTVAYPSFLMLTAISNLFGVGGASAIAQALGAKEWERARQLSSTAFWFGLCSAVLYALLFFIFAPWVLVLCGATASTYDIVFRYVKWAIVIGGQAAVMNTLLANLIRAEGNAAVASLGVSMGGILNIILDPIFVLPQMLGMGAAGAGLATAISNLASAGYLFLYLIFRSKGAFSADAENSGGQTALSVAPDKLRYAGICLKPILSIGLSSALQYALTVVAVAAQAKFVSGYPTEAVAGLGITKKLDQLPLYFSIGVANGLLPLLAYNYTSGNQQRRKQVFRFGTY